MPRLRWFALLAGLTGVYFLAGRVGLEFFGLLNPSASAVWPPTGVAIAALLVVRLSRDAQRFSWAPSS